MCRRLVEFEKQLSEYQAAGEEELSNIDKKMVEFRHQTDAQLENLGEQMKQLKETLDSSVDSVCDLALRYKETQLAAYNSTTDVQHDHTAALTEIALTFGSAAKEAFEALAAASKEHAELTEVYASTAAKDADRARFRVSSFAAAQRAQVGARPDFVKKNTNIPHNRTTL